MIDQPLFSSIFFGDSKARMKPVRAAAAWNAKSAVRRFSVGLPTQRLATTLWPRLLADAAAAIHRTP
jgi:hypothetical protein